MKLYIGLSSVNESLFYEKCQSAFLSRTRKGLQRTKITSIIPIFDIMDRFPRYARLINGPFRDIYGYRLNKKLIQECIKINEITKNEEIWNLLVINEEGTIFTKLHVQCVEKPLETI